MYQDIAKESATKQMIIPETESITNKGDFHGISESKIITEHRCTMEATMRLEHKSTHLDLPTLTKRPKTPTGQDMTDAKTNIKHVQIPPNIPQVPQPPETNIQIVTKDLSQNYDDTNKTNEITMQKLSSEQSIKSSLHDLLMRSEKKKTEHYSKAEQLHLVPKQVEIPLQLSKSEQTQPTKIDIPIKVVQEKCDFIMEPGSPPEICFVPKTESSSKVQLTFEKHNESMPTYAHSTITTKDVKIEFPKPDIRSPATLYATAETNIRPVSPKCSAEGVAMTRLWGKPMNYKSDDETDTIPKSYISNKIKELNAPFLVKEASECYTLLEPGSPPEICFAPKPTERRESLVESMERTLEKNLLQGPTKVLPHSVPTLTPPSASPATTQKPLVSKPPPPTMPAHLSTTRYDIYESDYESDRYKYSGSESDESSLRPKLQNNEQIQSQPQPAPTFYHAQTKISGYAADTEDPNIKQYMPYSTIAMSSSYSEIKSSSTPSFEKQEPAPIYYTYSNGNEPLIEHEIRNENQVDT